MSRTVVREAIASLRADRLVEAKQGAGVFVLEPQAVVQSPLLSLQNIDPERVSSMIEVLELRTAVEVEAAGLAALRRRVGLVLGRCRLPRERLRFHAAKVGMGAGGEPAAAVAGPARPSRRVLAKEKLRNALGEGELAGAARAMNEQRVRKTRVARF